MSEYPKPPWERGTGPQTGVLWGTLVDRAADQKFSNKKIEALERRLDALERQDLNALQPVPPQRRVVELPPEEESQEDLLEELPDEVLSSIKSKVTDAYGNDLESLSLLRQAYLAATGRPV